MRNNLSPESAPWGRDVDTRLSKIESTIATLNQDSTNAFKSIASSLEQLSSQVTAVETSLNWVTRNTTQFFVGTEPALNIPANVTTPVYLSSFTKTLIIPPYCQVVVTYSTGSATSLLFSGANTSGSVTSGLRVMYDRRNSAGFKEASGAPKITQNYVVGTLGVSPSLSSSASLGNTGFSPETWDFDLQAFGQHPVAGNGSNHAFSSPQLMIQTIPYA